MAALVTCVQFSEHLQTLKDLRCQDLLCHACRLILCGTGPWPRIFQLPPEISSQRDTKPCDKNIHETHTRPTSHVHFRRTADKEGGLHRMSPLSVPESPFAVQGLARCRLGPRTPDFTRSLASGDDPFCR